MQNVFKGPIIIYGQAGSEEKVGGGYENFLMGREWARGKIKTARVGIEILWHDVEWAMKFFVRALSGTEKN